MHSLAGNVLGYVIFALIILLTYVYWHFKKSHRFFDENNIPYVKPKILLGNLGDAVFKRTPIPWLHLDLYKKLEPHKFAGYFNFHSPFMMIRDPELIKHVMIKDFNHFHDRRINASNKLDRLGNHLLTMTGEEWKNNRIRLTRTFTSGKIKLMFPLVKICGDKLAQVLETMTDEPIDVKDLCARYTIDVIGTCVFGIDTHSLEDPESEFKKMAHRIFQFRFKALLLATWPGIPKSLVNFFNLRVVEEGAQEFIISLVENTVKFREQNNIIRNDFIDLLLSLKNESIAKYEDQDEQADVDQFLSQVGSEQTNGNIEMSTDSMAAQCFIFFAAGFETPAQTLGFLLLELAMHPEIQSKVRDEINTIIANNPNGLTYELLNQMPYVDMVTYEALRKYPGTAFAIRQCTIDYQIPNSNVTIPKNTPVIIPVLGLHRDPKYYEKPDEFYPEHFTKEAIANRPRYTYLPFGDGPRACIAKRFARMQVKVGLISMMRNFSFEISPKTELPVKFQQHFILIKAKGGIWLRCKKI